MKYFTRDCPRKRIENLPERRNGSFDSCFLIKSDSPVNDDSSTLRSFDCTTTPSAGNKSPYLTWQISPTTMSLIGICRTLLSLTTLNFWSSSIFDCRPRNCRSFVQSLNAVTRTTTMTAIMIAAPSIHSTLASSTKLGETSRIRSHLFH